MGTFYLNPEQEAAVSSRAKFIVVVASPGTGKTSVIVERIATNAANGKDQSRTVVITYTNAAAKHIAGRLAAVGVKVAFVGTLHAFCLRLIHKHGPVLGYRKDRPISILSEDARKLLLIECKNRLGYPKLSDKALKEETTPQAKSVMAEFRHAMKRASMIDYDGILAQVVKLVDGPMVGKIVVGDLYIDECQDSGESDWIIYRGIVAEGSKFYCGDFDQSIFRFRGAIPAQFIAQAQHSATTLLKLERNYRSAPAICQLANNLISHNSGRIEKTINPDRGEDALIETIEVEASRREALEISAQLRQACSVGMIPYREMAVLARTNAIADEIRATIREMGIPTAETERNTLPADWSLCLTTLQLIQNPANDLLCEQYLTGILWPLVTMNRAKMEALKTGRSLQSLTIRDEPMFSESRPLLARLASAKVSPESVALVADRLNRLPDDATTSDLMADLWNADGWEAPIEHEGVTVCTIHRSKGLEFELVIMAGMEEGVLPSLSKTSDLEEERRLCFVGVTRAKSVLLFTYCKTRFMYGKHVEMRPSRFLYEMSLITHE